MKMHPVIERAVDFRECHIDQFGEAPKGPFIIFESEWESLKEDPRIVAHLQNKGIETLETKDVQIAGMRIKIIKGS